MQLEIPREVVETVLELAKRERVPVLLNAAPALYLSYKFYPAVTHLIVNKLEAAMLYGESIEVIQNAGTIAGWKVVAKQFRKYGVEYVVITLGVDGVMCSSRETGEINVFALDVDQVVDTTTAGDTFIGAYAGCIVQQGIDKIEMLKAVNYGLTAAAYVVQRAGTQETIPWKGQLEGQQSSISS